MLCFLSLRGKEAMQIRIALAAEPDLDRNGNRTVLHLLTHPLDKALRHAGLAAQHTRSLRQPAKITRGEAEPAPG